LFTLAGKTTDWLYNINRFQAIRYLVVFFTSKKHALIFILKLSKKMKNFER
jgi:hypothetical protein